MEGSYRFAAAPRFPCTRNLEGRLERNGGAERKEARFLARDGWTPLAATELAEVTAAAPAAMVRPGELAFFQIPERLRAAWWAEAEREGEEGHSHHVLSEILEFLRFKRLPLPERVALRVAASLPDLASTRGLAFGDPPPVASINLGDEPSWLVVLPLRPLELAARIEAAGGTLEGAATPTGLVSRFFETFPHEPLLRFRLDPGEGLWFPAEGVIHDGWTRGRTELEVMLQLSPEVEGGPPPPTPSLQERKETT